MLRTYKFLVMPVIQETDDRDNVIGEVSPEQPDVVFGVRGLADYAEKFEAELATRNVSDTNGSPIRQQQMPPQPTIRQ